MRRTGNIYLRCGIWAVPKSSFEGYIEVRKGELTRKLRRSSADKRHKARGIDDTSPNMKTFGFICRVLAHGEYCVFTTPPNALQIDLHGQIPNLLLRVDGVVVLGVHDTWLRRLSIVVPSKLPENGPALLNLSGKTS